MWSPIAHWCCAGFRRAQLLADMACEGSFAAATSGLAAPLNPGRGSEEGREAPSSQAAHLMMNECWCMARTVIVGNASPVVPRL